MTNEEDPSDIRTRTYKAAETAPDATAPAPAPTEAAAPTHVPSKTGGMFRGGADPTISLPQSSADGTPQDHLWNVLHAKATAFEAAWSIEPEPPSIDEQLAGIDGEIKTLVLIELVKIDLQHRWQRKIGKRLPEYLAAYPLLLSAGRIPVDLIWEEYRLRHANGDPVTQTEYIERYPAQADEIRRLLTSDETAMISSRVVAPARSPLELEAGQTLEDFEVLQRLGKGAFATVYLAWQKSMQRLVALKVSADRGNEAQTMAQLDHPHVVRVFDQRRMPERGLLLLYMQYVAGGTLEGVVKAVRKRPAPLRRGDLLTDTVARQSEGREDTTSRVVAHRQRLAEAPWPEVVCWIGSRIAGALDYAHQRGVLHRDLKPANVLLTPEGSPKLADFNISFSSRVVGATAAAYFGGSLAYMSPEQLEAFNPAHDRKPEELDARSDVYSLGVLIWELLTGQLPFRDSTPSGNWALVLEEMVERRRQGVTVVMLSQLPPDTPTGLDVVLTKCLTADRSQRYQTAGEVARQLELCLRPRAQNLIRPRPRAYRNIVWSLLAAGLIPNVVCSILNISYNVDSILKHVAHQAVIDLFFQIQLGVVNGIAYTFGIGFLMWLAWPIIRAVWKRAAGEAVLPAEGVRVRQRVVHFGDTVAKVSAIEWAISGVVFPLWLHMAGAQFTAGHLLHFVSSQVICGMLAATLSYFFVTWLLMRTFYPVLVDSSIDDLAGQHQLAWLERQTWVYFFLAVAVPFLALLAMVFVEAASRTTFGVLGLVGLVASGLAFVLSRAILSDLGALAMIISPNTSGSVSTETADSFWSLSR